MSELQWINHASFVFRHRSVALICDPWLDGTAFDDGWSLLSPTQFTVDDFQDITHIWFSHEHPDHFSPPNIMRIPEQVRRQITVLFQTTDDGKVAAFCRRAGFNVVEMPSGQWMDLGDSVSVLCQPHKDGDSMLGIRTPDHTILNLNDCIVRRKRVARSIADLVGPIDVLMTQFSYANWCGNPEDVSAREYAAYEQLMWIKLQCEVLKPRTVIPFASFVWFSHEENAYMNDATNRIDDVALFVENIAECVVLYPGDRWTVGEGHDSGNSIRSYLSDYDTIPSRELTRSPTVPLAEIDSLANRFMARLREENGFFLPWLIRPAVVFITDHNVTRRLSFDAPFLPAEGAVPDISVSSAALANCFKHQWGGATLQVNGRFTVPKGGKLERFSAFMKVSARNNIGKRVGPFRAFRLRRLTA